MTTVWQAVRTPSPTRTRIVLLYAFLALFTIAAFGLFLTLGSAYPGFVRPASWPTPWASATPSTPTT